MTYIFWISFIIIIVGTSTYVADMLLRMRGDMTAIKNQLARIIVMLTPVHDSHKEVTAAHAPAAPASAKHD